MKGLKTVLLIDSNAIILRQEKNILEKIGYRVITAGGGAEALRHLEKNGQIQLILMDIDLAESLAPKLKNREIPLVLLTAHGNAEARDRARSITPYGCILKNSGEWEWRSSLEMAMALFTAGEKNNLYGHQLEISRESFKRIWEFSRDLICITDLDQFRFQDVNPAFLRVLGFPEKELRGRRYREYIHPEDVASTDRIFAGPLSRGAPSPGFTNRFRCRDDTYRHLEWHCYPLPTQKQLYALALDITGRIESENSLRKSKETAERYLNIAAEIIISLDRSGKIILLNDSGHQLLGYRNGELIGRNWFTTCVPPGERQTVAAVFEQIMTEQLENVKSYQNNVITSDGKELIIQWHNTLLKEENGRITGTLSSGENITQRKKAEEEAQELLREKELLMQEAQHRIKNDINLIQSFLKLQAVENDNPAVTAALQEAANRVAVLANVYANLFQSDDLNYVALPGILERLIMNLRHSIIPEHVDISTRIDNLRVRTKLSVALGIIINELITNAVKYAFPGIPHPRISITVKKRDEETLETIVTDNGIGTPPLVASGQAYGFGLTITNALVIQHDGSLEFDSRRGTRVMICLKFA